MSGTPEPPVEQGKSPADWQEADVELSCADDSSHYPLTGTPRCGLVYLRHHRGRPQPAVDVAIGVFTGSAGGQLGLTFTSLAELDAFESAIRTAHNELSMWFNDHRGAVA